MGQRAGELLEQHTASTYEALNANYRPTADTLVKSAEAAHEAGKEHLPEQLAIQALAENITSGRASAYLLSLYTAADDMSIADQVAEISSKLWSAHSYAHFHLANYWAKKERPDKVLSEWHILMTRNGAISYQFFPPLYQLISQSEYTHLLKPYTSNPPLWWESFFIFLTRNADFPLLQKIYAQRLSSSIPLSDKERSNYINRLIKEKHWQEARVAWLKTASQEQQRLEGLVYDGGFEGESFNSGFDWQISQNNKEIAIKPDITYGMQGQRALHIRLNKDKPINFQHVSQRLLLPSGHYQLSLLYRLDTFKSSKGLLWRIRCVDDQNTIIAETAPLKGQKPWSSLTTEFDIPDSGCPIQLLRLEAASRYRHDWIFEGNIWFDDIEIKAVHKEKNDE